MLELKKVSNYFGVKNQFVITDEDKIVFQSYETLIAVYYRKSKTVILDTDAENYSRTTSKYLKRFIEEIAGDYINCKKDYSRYKRENLN